MKIYKLPWRKRWNIFTDEDLLRWRGEGGTRAKYAEEIWQHWCWYEQNRLAYFLPHGPLVTGEQVINGVVHASYDKEDESPHVGGESHGAAFINDQVHDLVMNLKSTQSGGTCHGTIASLLRIIPCKPEWPCFKEHGVQFIPWSGPKEWSVFGYDWGRVGSVIWAEYLKFLPKDQVSDDMREMTSRRLKTGKYGSIDMPCGTTIYLFTYTQAHQRAIAGMQLDGGQLDEQAPEDMFDEYIERLSTRRVEVDGEVLYRPQSFFTLTGHVVEDMPYTGGAGWLRRKLFDGRDTKGLSVAVYRIMTQNTPDAIVPPEVKAEKYERYVAGPKRRQDQIAQRRGLARWYADWEPTGAMVLHEWNPEINVIEPTKEIWKLIEEGTHYRGIDPGRSTAPTACLLASCIKSGDLVLFDEYYERGRGIADSAADIVEKCGNRREVEEVKHDERTGKTWTIWREVPAKMTFYYSDLDGHSFNTGADKGNISIGEEYNESGLECQASKCPQNTAKQDNILTCINEWFRPCQTRKHLVTGKPGAPRIYVLSTLEHLREEIETWGYHYNKQRRMYVPDHTAEEHLICCLKFIMARKPVYIKDFGKTSTGLREVKTRRNPITGYRPHIRVGPRY